jgi:hypothetical protein
MLSAVPALLSMLAISAAENFAVVDVDAVDAMMGLGAQVTRQLIDGAKTERLIALTPDQIRTQLTPEKYGVLKKCRDNTACVAQALAGTAITRVITGSLSRDEKHYLLKLWHHDVKNSKLVCSVDRAVLIAARRFQKDVEQAVPGLLRGEQEARGTLIIDSNVSTAQIWVNGELVGTPPITMTVKPGKYEVKIERNKYLPVSRLLTVEANQTTTETIKLLLIPGQVADDELTPKRLVKKTDEPRARSFLVPTWVAGSATIAAGIGASVFGILARRAETSLRGGFDEAAGFYQGTRAQALEQNRDALIANVAFVALGVAAVATAVFILIDFVSSSLPSASTGSTP